MKDDDKTIRSGPLKGKKIEFAPTSDVDMFQTIADDFMKRIMDLDPGDYLISDESILADFASPFDSEDDNLYERIKKEYDVDVSNVKSGNLVEIFRLIHRRKLGGNA